MKTVSHSTTTYKAIRDISAVADTLVTEYKEAGFMPSLNTDPSELITIEQAERMIALAIRDTIRRTV
ncbi:hypothetical protein [Pseudomonas tolaasii]